MQNKIQSLYYAELDYFDGYESFCYQNCLRLLLKSIGIKDSWSYINASMSILYKDKELQQHSNIRSLLPEFSSFVQRLYYDNSVKAEDVFEENIDFILKNDMPIIVGVDTYYLNYTSNYMKNHAIHTLILCGYDSVTDDVYIIDWYAPWFFKGTIKKAVFLKSRQSKNEYDGSIYSGTPIRNNWAYIKKDIMKKNKKELLNTVIKLSLEQCYNPSNSVGEAFIGIEALRKLSEDVRKDGYLDYEAIFHQFYGMIKRHSFFKQYLVNYSNSEKDDSITVVIESLNNTISIMNIVSMLLLKQSKSSSTRNLERIIKNMSILIDNEEFIKNQLYLGFK